MWFYRTHLDVHQEELLVLDAVPRVALLGALVVGVLPVLVQPDDKVQHRPRHLELHVESQRFGFLEEVVGVNDNCEFHIGAPFIRSTDIRSLGFIRPILAWS